MLLQRHPGGLQQQIKRSATHFRQPNAPLHLLRHRKQCDIRVSAKGPTPPELTGFWSTLIAEQLSGVTGLSPSVSYLVSHGVGHLVMPLLEAVLVVWVMRWVAAKVQHWCEAHPERPLLSEVVGLLPAAIKGPTVFTLCTMVTLRLMHNAAYLLGNFMYKYQAVTYGKAADALLLNLCGSLQPMGKMVVKLYAVIMVLFFTTVLVKLKSLGLSILLEREREQQEALIAASGGVSSKARSMDDLERLLVPFDAATSWLVYAVGMMGAAQLLGVDVAPLIAVGGAGSIIIGLATQQLLTNAFMGLSLFFTRPFVDGDSVLVQAPGNMVVSGVVEKTTIMRTTLRTDDDVVVTIPNKTVADMIVFNRSADVRRSRLASVNRQTENIKLRLKLPYTQEDKLRELQETVKAVLEPPTAAASSSTSSSTAVAATASSSNSSSGSSTPVSPRGSVNGAAGSTEPSTAMIAAAAAVAATAGVSKPSRSNSPFSSALQSLVKPRVGAAAAGSSSSSSSTKQPGHPVVSNSVEVVISRFTDSGLELLVKAKLRVEPSNSSVQALLLELSSRVRQLGAMMVNV